MLKQAVCPLIAVLACIAACSQPAGPGENPVLSIVDNGARIYGGNCSACHQPAARGVPAVYPSLVGSPVLLGDPRVLARWVAKGQRPAAMPAGRYATQMPQFGWMKASDAAALFTYLRTGFGNEGSPVAVADISTVWGE